MFKFIGRLIWLAVFLAVCYVVLFFLQPSLAAKVSAIVGIPPEWNQKLADLGGFASGAIALGDAASNFSLTGVKNAITDLNAKAQPLVEKAVNKAQEFLSGAAQLKDQVISAASGANAAFQEKRQQLNDAVQAADQLSKDYQNLKDSVNAVVSKPTVYSGTGAATGTGK